MCIECDTLVENCACKVCPKEAYRCPKCGWDEATGDIVKGDSDV